MEQEGKLMPNVKNDSDTVHDVGMTDFKLLIKTLFKKGQHHIIEAHESGENGWCEMICLRTGHKYRHIICCPNKFALLCRGCNKVI
mgnify:CR=1 FL=1